MIKSYVADLRVRTKLLVILSLPLLALISAIGHWPFTSSAWPKRLREVLICQGGEQDEREAPASPGD